MGYTVMKSALFTCAFGKWPPHLAGTLRVSLISGVVALD